MKTLRLLLLLLVVPVAFPQNCPTVDGSAVPNPGCQPDYFGVYANYANSPLPTVVNGVVTGGGLRKFIDTLPGVGPQNASTLGSKYYIPIANKSTSAYTGSDFYQIGVVQDSWQFHRDLPKATTVRGYKDLSWGTDGNYHYIGPLIIAKRDVPVRLKF